MGESVQRVLSALDYSIFAGVLLVSLLIGIYYAYRDRNSKAGTKGYLMANRSMGVIPVAISLAVSFQSALTLLGVPADVYVFGMMYEWIAVSLILVCIVVSFVFIPTLYSLRISSTYEYLERRYSKGLRLLTTAMYIIQNMLYMGVNIYGPALALSGVTGFPLVAAMLSTGLVCIIYTTLGGLRGVIWTDVFQGAIMVIGMLAFIIQGSIVSGGFGNVWAIASEGGRTELFRLQGDPRIRWSTWSSLVGNFFIWLGIYGTNQAQVQRLLSVKSQKKAIKALWFGALAMIPLTSLAVTCGLVLYAFYSKCDPIVEKCVGVRDQLMPYAVMDLFRDIPGIPGIFLSSVFAASLSTVSSGINSMITVTVEDFVKPHTKWTESQYTWLSKGLGILFGAATLGISFLASVLGDILTVGVACVSAFTGPSLGMFLLGIWFPFVNTMGAGVGFLAGNIFAMIMFYGSRIISKPKELEGYLVVSTSHCPEKCGYMDSVNISHVETTPFTIPNLAANSSIGNSDQESVFNPTLIENLYAISFLYIATFAMMVTLIVGLLVSLLTCGWKHRHEVDRSLIRPPFESTLFAWIPENIRCALRCGVEWTDYRKDAKGETGEEFEGLDLDTKK